MINSESLLKQIKERVLSNEPLAQIFLYGSRARGNERKDSDYDLLILIKHNRISFEFEKKITDSLYDLEIETGEIISPMIYSEHEWNSKYRITPFYRFVMKDARLI
jgi:predicted nucleotidyltransferase